MRFCLCLLALAAAGFAANPKASTTLNGKLLIKEGQPPRIETADQTLVTLAGDDTTSKVLTDKRLDGFEVQAKGHFTSPGHFLIDPSYNHSLLVRKDGKLKLIAYWCDTCSIRAYTPGACVCCQRETTLDLIDPDKPPADGQP